MAAGGKPDDDARQAILGPAAAGVIAPTGIGDGLEFGRYKVVASIGRGGMGEVYLARTRGLGRDAGLVALKVLLAEEADDDELIGMFMDEASIMAQIHHPNVLAVSDFGKENDSWFLAMEYLSGRPLVRVMIDAYSQEKGLDPTIIALIGADAARGLHAAHTATGSNDQPLKVVHRDVSPQNIFITWSGVSKVIDFGVARASERVSHTSAGQLKGKAAYMSPEQINGGTIDGQSDIFALGTCLWEMAAGCRLFKKESDYDTMAAVLQGEIKPPSSLRPAIDPELDTIILDALERSPKKRIKDGGVLCERLLEYARSKGAATDGSHVAALITRLYAQTAAEERQLIRLLEKRAATESEEEALRQLSGIAPTGALGQVTLVGRGHGGLAELDRFGRYEEIKTVQVNTAALMQSSIEAAEVSADPQRAALPSPEVRADAIRRAVTALQKEHEAAVVGGNPKAREALGLPARNLKAQIVALLPYALIAIVVAAGVVAAMMVATKPAEQIETAPPVAEPPPIVVDEIQLSAPRAPGDGADVVLPQLDDHGIDVVRLGGKLAMEDEQGSGPVSVDGKARFIKVRMEHSEGWLALSAAPDTTSVVWLGSVGGERWRARGLSINDCPATARAVPQGIELIYREQRTVLPPGGGAFGRLVMRRPAFATRMELPDLGLAFGQADPERPGTLCSRGWTETGVRLERVPLGRYTVHWVGPGQKEIVQKHVRAERPRKKKRRGRRGRSR